MARFTGNKGKIVRRFNEAVYGPDKTLKILDKRPYAPGQHGKDKKRGKASEYSQQLLQKQKAKYMYGMLEKQFHIFYERCLAKRGNTGDLLLQMLESRLDNVVYRLGLAATRPAARQLVSHAHIEVDGKVVNIPSYIVKPGQKVGLRQRDLNLKVVAELLEHPVLKVEEFTWLSFDAEKKCGTFVRVPDPAEVQSTLNMQAIVELYSR